MNDPSAILGADNRERLLATIVDSCLRDIEENKPPQIERYIQQHPELADELGALLPALCAMGEFEHAAQESESPQTVSAADPLAAQARLGDFHIEREIGRGGMGVVYQALQVSLNRRVALKVLPFASVLEPTDIQRFKNEAQIAAQVHHPHIVPVYAVGCENGVHYYAMQLIEGQTFAQLIRRLGQSQAIVSPDEPSTLSLNPAESSENQARREKPASVPSDNPPSGRSDTARAQGDVSTAISSLSRSDKESFRTIARWGIQAAEALNYAHSLGLVHRDVKPSNLLLDHQGKLWVSDFGLAKITSGPQLTLTGDLVGTIAYMSPEQTGGGTGVVDHRSDIYSLGATLYELAGLQRVFTSGNRMELLKQVANDEPKHLRQVNKHVPIDLETIVHKALAKNAGDRYDSARALAQDLQRFLEDRPIHARRPTLADRAGKWVQRHRLLVLSLAALLLLTTFGSLVSAGLVLSAKRQTDAALATTDEALTEARQQKQTADDALERERAAQAAALQQEAAASSALERERDALAQAQDQQAAAVAALERENAAILEQQQQTAFAQQAVEDLYLQLSMKWMRESPPRSHIEGELMQKAVDYFDHLAEVQGDDEDSLNKRAIIYARMAIMHQALEQFEEAHASDLQSIALFQQLDELHPKRFDIVHNLAEAYVRDSYSLHELGMLNEMRNELNLAAPLIRSLQSNARENPDIRILTMRFNLYSGRYFSTGGSDQNARDHWQEGLDRALPTDNVGATLAGIEVHVQILKEFAGLLNKEGRPQQALQYIQQAREALQTAKEYAAAPWLTESLTRDLDLAETFSHLQLGHDAEALRTQHHAVEISKGLLRYFPDVELFASNLVEDCSNLCSLQFEIGLYAEASKSLQIALELSTQLRQNRPDVPLHRRNHFRVLKQVGSEATMQEDWEAANKAFAASVALGNEQLELNVDTQADRTLYGSSLVEYARFLALVPDPNYRDPEESLRLVERAMEVVPRDRRSYRILALLLYRMGDHQQAEAQILHTNIELSGYLLEAHLVLAMAYERGELHELALEYYELARTLYNDPAEIQDALTVALFREAEERLGIPAEEALPQPPPFHQVLPITPDEPDASEAVSEPPTDAPPTDEPPTDAPPTDAPPTDEPAPPVGETENEPTASPSG